MKPLFSALHFFEEALLHFGLEAPPALVSDVCNCHQPAAAPLLLSPLLSSSPLFLQYTITSMFPPSSNHSHLRSGSSCLSERLSAAPLLVFTFSHISSSGNTA